MNRTDQFPLADRDLPALSGLSIRDVRAVWTGEKRPPRKGEWYLSGAIVETYRAPNDITEAMHIARLVQIASTPVLPIVAMLDDDGRPLDGAD